MDHLSDFMQLTYVTSARTCTRSCYGRFMQPGLVAYYTCGTKAFFPIRQFHAKYLRIYEANFVIAEVHVDFSIMDSE